MNTFLLVISSPDGDVFRDEVRSVSVRGVEGDLAVLAGHIPFVTTVKPCDVKIVTADGSSKIGTTEGGILTVGSDITTLLSGSFTF
ncbi:MAG: F0F1 ATP synthase subunit epsilon [Clostridia bacterium]|nr:F0F1 ATP synthase subunit epsilon [Clostridia bacterium]